MSEDTKRIQEAIVKAASGSEVKLEARLYIVDETIECRGDVNLYLPAGCNLFRKRLMVLGKPMLRYTGRSGGKLYGAGILDCNARNRTWDEHDHAVSLRLVRDFEVTGITIYDGGGDGVYEGTVGSPSYAGCENIRVHHVSFRGANRGRNCVSVIGGKNLRVEDNYMRCWSREHMPGFVDLEPNLAAESIVGATVARNVMDNVGGTRVLSGFYLANNHGSVVRDIVVAENTYLGNFSAGATYYSHAGGETLEDAGNFYKNLASYCAKFDVPKYARFVVRDWRIENCAKKWFFTEGAKRPIMTA